MPSGFDWDNIRLFLALYRAGSLREGAAQISISHPTARRRLNHMETELGLKLFYRGVDGLTPTPNAKALYETAIEAEKSMLALERRAVASEEGFQGEIRVSVPTGMSSELLMPALAHYQNTHPDIQLQIFESNAAADLERHEADIVVRAVRKGNTPKGELVGRRAGRIFQAIYGDADCWLGWYGDERDAEWIAQTPFPDLPIGLSVNGLSAQKAACILGMGRSLVPCFFLEGKVKLMSEPSHYLDLWVLVHPDLKNEPHLREFRDYLYQVLADLRPALEGEAPLES